MKKSIILLALASVLFASCNCFHGGCYTEELMYVENRVSGVDICMEFHPGAGGYFCDENDSVVASNDTFVYFFDSVFPRKLVSKYHLDGEEDFGKVMCKCQGTMILHDITFYNIVDSTSYRIRAHRQDKVFIGDEMILESYIKWDYSYDYDIQYGYFYFTVTDSLLAHMEKDTANYARFKDYYSRREF